MAPNPAAQISWEAAESHCQTYGTNVHLAAGDTHQVSSGVARSKSKKI